jgi:thymidylate synthase ThyX
MAESSLSPQAAAGPAAPRVITVAPLPPEKCAYALARYSRSPDSIAKSLDWVRTHDSAKFLESFYFQYGHASIADLGHVVLCFEGISELAATEVEDEPLWDGQARSSRYQNFSRSGFVVPDGLEDSQLQTYRDSAALLLSEYQGIHAGIEQYLSDRLPRPQDMKPDAYHRNIAARAFDVARYLLFWGIPTGVGQVTSIRTLEKQIRRMKASPYAEVRSLAAEIAEACTRPPVCSIDSVASTEPIAPTLAKYVDPDAHVAASQADLATWAEQNLSPPDRFETPDVDLLRPACIPADVVATLLYPVTTYPFRWLYELAAGWSESRRGEVIDVALQSRTRRDELLRGFRGGLYCFDMIMDIGAYRDMHRHRRCHQFRQAYGTALGYDVPQAIVDAGLSERYKAAVDRAFSTCRALPSPQNQYVLPFATRSRFLFKMDFAEAEYMSRLRSGVKGHFSYRRIAWEMKCARDRVEPELGRLIEATPPWIEDPLKR